MADLSARDAITRLKGAGWSQSQIADAVGRDQSYISQIARGLKPGSTLTEPLELLAAGNTDAAFVAAAASRRTRDDGTVASTRGGRPTAVEIGGVYAWDATSAGAARGLLAWMARQGRDERFAFRLSFEAGEVEYADGTTREADADAPIDAHLGRHGGYQLVHLLAQIARDRGEASEADRDVDAAARVDRRTVRGSEVSDALARLVENEPAAVSEGDASAGVLGLGSLTAGQSYVVTA